MRAERGWIGMVGLLLALVVVALLATTALRQYGLARPGVAPDRGASGGAGPARSVTPDAATASAIRAPLDRAREAEAIVERGAADRARAIDDATR